MKQYVGFIDGLPLVVKAVLALPGIDGLVYGLYRICKGRLIVGILWILGGATILWILDMYTIIVKGKISILV
jgi:hypothetical protein